MNQSQFTLFRDIRARMFGHGSREAVLFAMNRMALKGPISPIKVDPQLVLNLTAATERATEDSTAQRS